jgi:hypothetical protein
MTVCDGIAGRVTQTASKLNCGASAISITSKSRRTAPEGLTVAEAGGGLGVRLRVVTHTPRLGRWPHRGSSYTGRRPR